MTDSKKLKTNDTSKVNGGSRNDYKDWEIEYDVTIANCTDCGKPIYKGAPCGYRDENTKTGILCADCAKKLAEESQRMMDVGV